MTLAQFSLPFAPQSGFYLFNEAAECDFSHPKTQNLMPRGAGIPPNTEMPPQHKAPSCHLGTPESGLPSPVLSSSHSAARDW